MAKKFNISRREFFKTSASIGLGLYGMASLPSADAANGKSKVIISQNDGVFDDNENVDEKIVERLLHNALMKLAGTRDKKSAWRRYFKSQDIVGIKVNTLAGRRMSSHREIVKAIINGLKMVGVAEENIIVWDKSDDDLMSAGYAINKKSRGVKCFGTLPSAGYDSAKLEMWGSIAQLYSNILSRCTALVNVPVLKHHSMAGVTISLKNWFGAIHNPNKYHIDAAADPYIPDVNMVPCLRNKRQLVVCDALLAQYAHGPAYNPKYTWQENSLILSTDQVALDTVGTQIIERKRREKGLSSLAEEGVEPKYIAIAADSKHRLGTNDAERIEIVRV